MTPADFWDSTPREVVEVIRAASWRHREAERQAITTAWLVAAFDRKKHLPALDRVLSTSADAKQGKTPDEQLAFVRTLAKAHNRRLSHG